jgi:hypothetical protein
MLYLRFKKDKSFIEICFDGLLFVRVRGEIERTGEGRLHILGKGLEGFKYRFLHLDLLL